MVDKVIRLLILLQRLNYSPLSKKLKVFVQISSLFRVSRPLNGTTPDLHHTLSPVQHQPQGHALSHHQHHQHHQHQPRPSKAPVNPGGGSGKINNLSNVSNSKMFSIKMKKSGTKHPPDKPQPLVTASVASASIVMPNKAAINSGGLKKQSPQPLMNAVITQHHHAKITAIPVANHSHGDSANNKANKANSSTVSTASFHPVPQANTVANATISMNIIQSASTPQISQVVEENNTPSKGKQF